MSPSIPDPEPVSKPDIPENDGLLPVDQKTDHQVVENVSDVKSSLETDQDIPVQGNGDNSENNQVLSPTAKQSIQNHA